MLSLPYIARISVYPRWRGELISLLEYMSCAHGLSPLARGTPRHAGRAAIPPRFIPAGAGNSFSSSSIAVVLTVYPRWRGELLIRSSYSAPLAGLSPLARGTLISLAIINRLTRFIPAGAGNSRARGDSGRACTVYPRWRGELKTDIYQVVTDSGLSPLARGTLMFKCVCTLSKRFIPAGAGNSLNITYY